jgi:hypothetical protein
MADHIDNGIADADDIDAGLRHLAGDHPGGKGAATITASSVPTR